MSTFIMLTHLATGTPRSPENLEQRLGSYVVLGHI